MRQRRFIFYVEDQAGHPVCVVSSNSPLPGDRTRVWQMLATGEFSEGTMPIVFLDPELDSSEAREEMKAHLLFTAVRSDLQPASVSKLR